LDGKAVTERTVERGVITIRQNIHREDAVVRYIQRQRFGPP
jgi:hypothetical protein